MTNFEKSRFLFQNGNRSFKKMVLKILQVEESTSGPRVAELGNPFPAHVLELGNPFPAHVLDGTILFPVYIQPT